MAGGGSTSAIGLGGVREVGGEHMGGWHARGGDQMHVVAHLVARDAAHHHLVSG